MLNSTDTTAATGSPQYAAKFVAGGIPAWVIFAAGFTVGIVVVYWGVTRPMIGRLAQLDQRIAGLVEGVEQIAGAAETADESSHLLANLAQQAESIQTATKALTGMQLIQKRLVDGRGTTAEAERAVDHLCALRSQAAELHGEADDLARALDELDELQQRITLQYNGILAARDTVDQMIQLSRKAQNESSKLADARAALESLVALKNTAVAQAPWMQSAAAAVEQWSEMNQRLLASADQTPQALGAADELVALQTELLCRGSQEARIEASQSLDDLLAINGKLEAADTAAAHQRLDGLLSLKEQVLAETGNLADAVETLEAASDLKQQFVEAADSLDTIRRWMAEVVLMEPTFQRVLDTLEPLAKLGDLRRLSADELRQAARVIADDRAGKVARPAAGGGQQFSRAGGDPLLLDSIDLE